MLAGVRRWLNSLLAVAAAKPAKLRRWRPLLSIGACCGLLLTALVMGGCATSGSPVVVERSGSQSREGGAASRPARQTAPLRGNTYTVKRGDTLYSISRRAGTKVATLARLNGLRSPYRIYPGMKLRLKGQVAARRPAPRKAPTTRPAPSQQRRGTSQAGGLTWRWPTTGKVVREYGGVNKGLDFSVPVGAKVQAAGAGEVVYAGTGLAGYESLVIVRHNAQYLSAYSVNQPVAVREGQRIQAGHAIAVIRGSRTNAQALHFEIRRNGEPISPRSVLR